ncbi:MAG: hypothetical protein H7838_01465 [Magnetococcus sp. DMHC-8]
MSEEFCQPLLNGFARCGGRQGVWCASVKKRVALHGAVCYNHVSFCSATTGGGRAVDTEQRCQGEGL